MECALMSSTNRLWVWIGMAVLLLALFGETVRAQVFWVEEPSFAPPSGWVGYLPEFCDLDGDGDVDLAYSWADAAAILAEGQVIEQGLPAEIMRDQGEMESAHLRVPWVLAFAERLLRDDGHVDPAQMPQTFRQLLDHMTDPPGGGTS